MNTNPNATRILCYGDSNTWGQIPKIKGRFGSDIRWTGLLQKSLGDSFEVIEEGLSGRTTSLDQDPREGRNGRTYLVPCIESHNPVDIVILFLGTNDLKERFAQTPIMIAESIRSLIRIFKEKAISHIGTSPKILVISPAIVDESVPGTQEKYRGAEQKSKGLAEVYRKVADEERCAFLDLSLHVVPSKLDGYHFDQDAHVVIAKVVEKEIRRLIAL